MKKKAETSPQKKAPAKRASKPSPAKKTAIKTTSPKKRATVTHVSKTPTSAKPSPKRSTLLAATAVATNVPSDTKAKPIQDLLLDLVSKVPDSKEKELSNPKKRAQAIIRSAAIRAASTSGALALPPGPAGLALIVPDLMAVWHIQRQMVADVAAVYGKSADLTQETVLFCLFKHGGAMLMRDVAVRVGDRLIVKRATLRVLKSVLEKVGIRVTQKVIKQAIAKLVPAVGALAVGGYAYYDTAKVGATAVETFSGQIEIEND